MPSRPSLGRTVRKEAGTETRPLVSILLVNADTNWSISPSRTRADAGRLQKLEVQAPVRESGGRGGADPPVASKERGQPPPLTHRTGNHGIAWEFMGVNGERRERRGNPRENAAKEPRRSLLLVNRADCRFRAKQGTSANERGLIVSATDSRGALRG